MAYKNKEDQAKAARRHYEKNKDTIKARAKEHRKNKRAERYEFVLSLKNNPCTDCGVKYHPAAMDFDHVDGEKSFNIASGYFDTPMHKLIDELAKCELVCSNCHRVRTYNRSSRSGDRNSLIKNLGWIVPT